MKTYKGRTAQERRKSHYQMKKALKQGIIPPPKQCKRCGQTEGIIEYHNPDYSHPTKYLISLCYLCHMMEHSRETYPKATDKYFEQIKDGPLPAFYKRAYFTLVHRYLKKHY